MISFIIPTLNEEKAIEATLKNLSLYTGDKEIIISDGRSTDRTVEIAQKYTDKILVHDGKTRQTIAGGRNIATTIAKNNFFVFLDADVYIPDINNFFSKALDIFHADEKMVALLPSIRVTPELETFGDKMVFGSMDYVHIVLNNWLRIGGAPGEFQMIRADAFRKVGGYNEMLVAAEDHELLRRLAKIGRVHFHRKLRIYHPGRRAHKIGWIKLLWTWTKNGIYHFLFGRSSSKEWEEVR